jgi:nitrous oxidase accessory protein
MLKRTSIIEQKNGIMKVNSIIKTIVLAILSVVVMDDTPVFAQTPNPRTVVSSLQAMIDEANIGDTILVRSGTYEGNVVLNKRVALLGVERPVLSGDGKGSCVTLNADSCVIKGFIIEKSGGNLMNDDSGIFIDADHSFVEDNELRDVLFGIYLFQAHFNTIIDNKIVGRTDLELGQRGSGIHIWNSNSNYFSGNTITQARDGYYIQYAKNTLIERSEVFAVRYGLHYMYADSNTFLLNKFYDNVAGAAIMYSQAIAFRHNAFIRNRGFSSYGILFQDCQYVLADSNVIADNVVGIFFEATTDNIFRHNIIAQNDIALRMFQNSINNTFAENSFIDNLNQLSLVGKQTKSHWSEHGRGNYWSSYDGYDMNDDGIGDIPMKLQNVFQYLEGQNPNLRLYLYSPASQALATAARAFPIIEITEEADPHPLMRPVEMHSLPAVQLVAATDETSNENPTQSAGFWLAFPVAGVFVVGIIYHHFSKRGG